MEDGDLMASKGVIAAVGALQRIEKDIKGLRVLGVRVKIVGTKGEDGEESTDAAGMSIDAEGDGAGPKWRHMGEATRTELRALLAVPEGSAVGPALGQQQQHMPAWTFAACRLSHTAGEQEEEAGRGWLNKATGERTTGSWRVRWKNGLRDMAREWKGGRLGSRDRQTDEDERREVEYDEDGSATEYRTAR